MMADLQLTSMLNSLARDDRASLTTIQTGEPPNCNAVSGQGPPDVLPHIATVPMTTEIRRAILTTTDHYQFYCFDWPNRI
jgi:hypothetical protein